MGFRLRKFLLSSAYIVAGVYTFKLFFSITHMSGPEFFRDCVLVSGFWLALTTASWARLLMSYADKMSRVRIGIPVALGLVFSTVAFFGSLLSEDYVWRLPILSAALLEIGLWSVLYLLQERTRSHFVPKGYGLMPVAAWINPPASAMKEGDIILTSGRVARQTRNTVGHMELVLKRVDGEKETLIAFSSYMESGVVFHSLRALCKAEAKMSHYIALRPLVPMSVEQNREALRIAEEMMAVNHVWRETESERRTRLVEKYLPASFDAIFLVGGYVPALRQWVLKKYLPTGYDWLGLYTGRRFANRWTCMGACLEVLNKVGMRTRPYGTGLLGLGTGLFNPLMPVRFLAEPSYRLLTIADEAAGTATE